MNEPKKFAYIDVARAIAILMVIAVHCGQNVQASESIAWAFAYGQMGVQLFFVASALTLCLSASARKSEPPINFYTRRVFRIAPLYYLGIVFYLLWSAAVSYHKTGLFTPDDQYTSANILVNAFFLNGFYPPANNNIVPGGWSIGTEMAFYAIFPFLFNIVSNAKNKTYALPTSIAITQLALIGIERVTGHVVENNSFLYYNILTQINVFIVGMIYFWTPIDSPIKKHPIILFILFTVLSIIAWKAHKFYWAALSSGISFVGLIEALKHAPAKIISLLQPVGRYSFSMYLTSFFVINIVAFILKKIKLLDNSGGNWKLALFYAASCILTLLISQQTYKSIERPMIEFWNRVLKGNETAFKERSS